jgi:hypothetical protein
MAKQGARAEVNTFVQGLITEASPLNFPPNASVDEDNFILNRDGSRQRRLGMDFEDGYALRSVASVLPNQVSSAGHSSFTWSGVAGNDGLEFLVVQLNKDIKFFDLSADSITNEGYITSLQLDFPTGTDYSFASVDGKLIVAAGSDTIGVITYNSGSSFTVEYVRLRVRDIWGVEEQGQYESDYMYRDGVQHSEHIYNLRNQSWALPRKDYKGRLKDPIRLYFLEHQVFPSNSETVWPGLQYQPVQGTSDPFERIYPAMYAEVFGADVKAPKGSFIIDLLRRGQSRITEYEANYERSYTYNEAIDEKLGPLVPTVSADGTTITYTQSTTQEAVPAGWSYKLTYNGIVLPSDYTNGGASVVCEFAGRVFYAGFTGDIVDGDKRSPNLSNYVAFSQLVKSTGDITKCYQEGDPTSRENSDVVDTDGGVFRVSGADKIIGLVNIESHLIIIATNGVWAVSGGSDYGFTATNFKVVKISSYGGLSQSSIVEAGNQSFYWAEDGIYTIGRDKVGDLVVTSLTQQTIQTLYDEIPRNAKIGCKGVYDEYSKKIRWVYKQGEMFTETSVTKELILDTLLGSFYTHTIGNATDNDVEIVGVTVGSAVRSEVVFDSIQAGTDEVLAGTDSVGYSLDVQFTGTQSVRYIAVKYVGSTTSLTVAMYRDPQFVDWRSSDSVGVDAKAYLLTGSQTAGDSSIMKQIPYLIMHFRRTEMETDANGVPLKQSSCKVRTQWDWANTANSKKWSSLFQAYRIRRPLLVSGGEDYDTGFETVVTKNKIRGRGRAFALYMETEPGKDCNILGWNLTVNGNALA